MPEYKDLTQLGIIPVPFDILHPDHNRVKVITLQCSGQIDSNGHVVNADKQLSEEKFRAFLCLAKQQEAALAVTPEYSCPWAVLESVFNTQSALPRPGALWVIGCESITPDELNQLKDRTKHLISWHYEEVHGSTKSSFLSPALYLFQQEKDLEPKYCAIVQFKSHPMGGTDFEKDNLITGNVRYVLHNPDLSSIRMLCIICSDAITFNPDDLTPIYPYLLIHLQLNKNPYHPEVTSHRNTLFQSGRRQQIEILTLNWAQGFQFLGGEKSIDFGGSGYYMHPSNSEEEPYQDDLTVDANHVKGIYLRFSDRSRHSAYLFTPKEAVFEFETTKVSQCLAKAVNQSRSGVKAISTYQWQPAQAQWVSIEDIEDGVRVPFEANGGTVGIKPAYREKLLTICTGGISPDLLKWHMPKKVGEEIKRNLRASIWHRVRNMTSYCLDGYDSPKGTLTKLKQSQGAEISESITRFTNLAAYIKDKSHLPDILADYAEGSPLLELDPAEVEKKEIRHNLKLADGGGLATVVDIGSALPETANEKFADIKNTLLPQRLVVWYTHSGQRKYKSDEVRTITDSGESPDDFTRAGL